MSETHRSVESESGPGADAPVADAVGRLSDAFYALDTELAYTYVNDRVTEFFGPAEDGDERGESVTERIDSLFRESHERALESGEPVTVERVSEPTDRRLEARCHPDETGVTVLVRDVTERTARKRALEDDTRRLRSIFENANEAILVGDETEIAAANPAASELFDLDRSELAGRSLKEFVGDDHDVRSAWADFLERGRRRGSFSLVRPDGTERVVEYNSVADVLPGTHLSILRDVTEARTRERQLESQRERLAALDHVNGVVREITDAIVGGSTRAELERAACEALADSSSYEFAFVADVDARTREITHRVEAGIDGYVDSIRLSTDADDPAGRGPAGKAIRSGEIQVSTDVFSDPDFEPWRADAREHGYESAAAIPITHDGVLYGVLGVTSARRHAFADEERDVVGQLGEILGHAIAALERKRVLLGDDLTELELVIDDAVAMFDGPDMEGHTVRFDRVVRVGDEQFLEYGTTPADTFPVLEALVERVPHWDGVTVVDRAAGDVAFELEISSPPMFGVIDAHGGYVETAAIRDGDYTMTLHFPTGTDIRTVIDEISAVYPGARTVARRQVTTSRESLEQLQTRLAETLTDRQRTALEVAYYGGYFEWPRNSSGEELAASIDVTAPTFHEHLRAAQHKLVAAFVDEPRPTTPDSPDEQ